MSVLSRIAAGFYKPATQFPVKPVEPALLSKRVRDLTAGEVSAFLGCMTTYATDRSEYIAAVLEYNLECAKRINAFWDDIEAEFDMADHPKAEMVSSKAWDAGHSSGLAEVYSHYSDLVDLVR